ncbi:MAG TPA: hypothetical protein VLA37_06275, partial [Sphingomonadaceae bacterium]|nr:hypothetical protein [Sphingomonadaceae bacterium]
MIKGRKGEKLSVKLLRTVIAVLIAIALIPACLFAIAIGMGTGAANVDWRTWIAFVTAGFVGPMSLFFAMLQIWPWSEDDLEP